MLDNRQPSTLREYQSITTHRYACPRDIGVMSAHHAWSGRCTSTLPSKYGYFRCALSGALVWRGRHQIVSSPISRRSLLRRLRLTFRPWSRSSTFTRRRVPIHGSIR